MGSRGPIASSGGIRAERARKAKLKSNGATSIPKGSTPERPEWLPATATATWESVVRDLQAAGVVLAAIDAHATAFYSLCIEGARVAAGVNPNLVARFSRDAIAWGNLIGATPAARARMGIKQEPERPGNPWRQLAAGVPSTGIQELDAILSTPRVSKVKTQ